jgi:hypothetical protein
MRNVLVTTLGVLMAAGLLVAQSPVYVPPDPKLGQVGADFDNAKRLAQNEQYDEAIARAEDAIRKIKELRDAPKGQPDLVPIAINGDGNRVVITVQNQGNADVTFTPAQGRKQFTGFNVSIINANTNQPFDPHRPLRGSFTGSLPPGQTAQVQIGPITGCGGRNQPILAIVDTRAEESNTNNNRTAQPFTVRGGPCGS